MQTARAKTRTQQKSKDAEGMGHGGARVVVCRHNCGTTATQPANTQTESPRLRCRHRQYSTDLLCMRMCPIAGGTQQWRCTPYVGKVKRPGRKRVLRAHMAPPQQATAEREPTLTTRAQTPGAALQDVINEWLLRIRCHRHACAATAQVQGAGPVCPGHALEFGQNESNGVAQDLWGPSGVSTKGLRKASFPLPGKTTVRSVHGGCWGCWILTY
jgi:hypothetical protein